MIKIRIGGVPEHFNLPWHLAIEENLFEEKDIEVEWITFKGGTGAMSQALRKGEVDLCVILTEGIIKEILQGNECKIVSKYIDTPLIWGIHTGQKNELKSVENIFDQKIAISRKGSGSHLMPQVDAMIKGADVKEEQFVIVENLEGALKSLNELKSDVFYWEKYTTKPYVDSKQLRCLGEFETPWPCFVLAARNEMLAKFPLEILSVIEIVQERAEKLSDQKNKFDILSLRYNQKKEDIKDWFHSTKWSSDRNLDKETIANVVNALKKAGLIETELKINLDQLLFKG